MFSEFNYKNYPFIEVKFNNTVESIEDFNNFINTWDSINNKKEPYYFIFDTRSMGMVNIKYAVMLTKFISKLKKNKEQYLKGSIIYTEIDYIRYLLKFVFMMTSPISNVYIIEDLKFIKPICESLKNNILYQNKNVTLVKSSFNSNNKEKDNSKQEKVI